MTAKAKVALITGAGQGIGRAIALRLARDGMDIAIVDLKKEKMDDVANEVHALGRRATVYVADVIHRDQVYAAVDHAEKELDGFDIMINNAGIAQVQPLAKVTPKEVETILKVNLEGVLWGIQAAAKKFKDRGHKGKIINASSVAGHNGFAMLGVYSATKFAIRGLTQAAALEFASDGITVNAYCPGIVGTDMWVEIDKRFAELTGVPKGATYKKYVEGIALGRAETPEDVAAFVSYLASPDSDYMTGQAPIIDGGTLFLDEIGDMDLEVQAQLLKTIEEKSFRRIGENRVRKSNFRLICATHRDLLLEAKNNRFRSDLYYRICVFPVMVPALCKRVDDIPDLVVHILQNFGFSHFPLSQKIITLLKNYAFPGNVRELRNMLERAVLLSQGEPLTPAHFPGLDGLPALVGSGDDVENLHEVEKRHIRQILKKYNGDKKLTSEALGMSFSNLYRKLQQFRLAE